MKHLAILELQVPLEVVDSCTFSAADLVGGWVNQVKVNSYGVGTWDNGKRPPFKVTAGSKCCYFNILFPDDRRVYSVFFSRCEPQSTFGDVSWIRSSGPLGP